MSINKTFSAIKGADQKKLPFTLRGGGKSLLIKLNILGSIATAHMSRQPELADRLSKAGRAFRILHRAWKDLASG